VTLRYSIQRFERGEGLVTERAVAHDGDLPLRAVGNEAALDAALAQVIEHLVAGEPFVVERGFGFLK
jgi:hypothetical protein